MPKKSTSSSKKGANEIVYAPARPQPITEVIEKNYMPYAMTVIISRAIPEIDGLKPAHRKLLYTMYKMGLLTGPRTKSANVVGATMKLNPHGDQAIYETLVRLTRGSESLLHPLVDSKGSFGKLYSADMKYAASRYTEVKLDSFCAELFKNIEKDPVDFIDSYDGQMKEPTLLPTTFPNVLVTPNKGIAVGMASDICSHNLSEICDGTIALLKNPKTSVDKLMEIIKAPDFPGGGEIIYDPEEMRRIFTTGYGSIRVRSRYVYNKQENCIDIIQIPYLVTIESILKRITELFKDGKLKEITDFRDEIDLSGFKLTIDLRKGTDPDKLMQKLFKLTPLEDNVKCNYNILVNSVPRMMGIPEILSEWIKFRMGCLRRELTFDLKKHEEKLHLLLGLGKIFLDIDKAVSIIRTTEHESDVVPNLMKGFLIDEIQANFIADIKLRYLNREYILNRIAEIDELEKEIDNIKEILEDELKLKALIAKQLTEIKKKYGMPRKTFIVHTDDVEVYKEEEHIENYNAKIYMTKEGYFKKITLQSLRGNDEQKLKDGDEICFEAETDNLAELIIFSNQCKLYNAKVHEFEAVKASSMGEYIPAKLGMQDGEKPIFIKIHDGYREKENFVFLFENGKGVRVPTTAYETKAARKKLTGAYSSASPIVAVFFEKEKDPYDVMLISDADRAIVVKTSLIPLKTTRTASGVQIMTLKKGQKLREAYKDFADRFEDTKGYKKIKIPAPGILLSEKDINKQQLKF